MKGKKINIAILWHMHQPWYVEPDSAESIMPWVRLHTLKDYYDMPLLVQKAKKMKVTFNLVPSLMLQIEKYARGEITDQYLRAFMLNPRDMTLQDKEFVIKNFFAANARNFINPSPRYSELYARKNRGESVNSFIQKDIRDLQVHFELAWFGESMKDTKEIKRLIAKDSGYTEKDKEIILEFERKRLNECIDIYRKLQKKGLIELTTTPFYHPILPLLANTDNIQKADPTSPVPEENFRFPEDAEKQIKMGLEYAERVFGFRPAGMWPSEGSVSPDVLKFFTDNSIRWVATDEEILWKSLGREKKPEDHLQPWQINTDDGKIALFFRDHALSDKIGFTYSSWKEEEAVADFLASIRAIAENLPDTGQQYVLPIILDGENAWEYFPGNGKKFLSLLYKKLVEAEDIEPITFSEYLNSQKTIPTLRNLKPGSWISGNFRTWSGDPEKNKGWDLLAKGRKLIAAREQLIDTRDLEESSRHMMIAEGSDWFWWYGDGNFTPYMEEFDRLFRMHLRAAIEKAGGTPPDELSGNLFREDRTARFIKSPIDFIHPVIDGKITSFYEWDAGGLYKPSSFRGTMHGKGSSFLTAFSFGFDLNKLYLRFDGHRNIRDEFDRQEMGLTIDVISPTKKTIHIDSSLFMDVTANGKKITGPGNPKMAGGEILELAIPFPFLEASKDDEIIFTLQLDRAGQISEKIPADGHFLLKVPGQDWQTSMWYV
mgnify:CR=1 FL=1